MENLGVYFILGCLVLLAVCMLLAGMARCMGRPAVSPQRIMDSSTDWRYYRSQSSETLGE